MSSKLTRNFATKEELNQAGIIDADLFEDTLASLPTTAPLSVDGVSVVTGTKVLFGKLNKIYQATVSGATVSWEDISGSDLADTQKVLIDQGTVYNNDIVQNQSGSWNIANDGKAGGGSGEVNTASNVGGQTPIFKQKTGVDLEFRSLQGSGATTVTQTGDTITISSTDTNTGEVNTNSNAGATGAGLVKTKVGVDTPIKRIKAGTNITINENADDIEIVAAGGSPKILQYQRGTVVGESNIASTGSPVFTGLTVGITPIYSNSHFRVKVVGSGGNAVAGVGPYVRSSTSGILLDNTIAGTPILTEAYLNISGSPFPRWYRSEFHAGVQAWMREHEWYLKGPSLYGDNGGPVGPRNITAGVAFTVALYIDTAGLSSGLRVLNSTITIEEILA